MGILMALCLLSVAPLSAQKVGLALSGGGAKGAAEVGVLKVLEEAGIQVDYIVGTSIGAVVGSLYAAGYTAAELESLFCQQEWLSLLTDRHEKYSGDPYKTVDGVTYIFGFPVIDHANPSFGMLRGSKVEHMLDSMFMLKGIKEFKDLKKPFACVAAELKTADEVVISKGALSKAIRASMSIPGVFKPVNINGRQLIDGGMMNNLPVDVVRQMGADIVIAIDLQQHKPVKRKISENPLWGLTEMLGFGGLADWVLSRPDINKYYDNCASADIIINPQLAEFEVSSFGNKKMAVMMEIGEKAAREHMYELTELWKHLHAK